MVQKSVPLVESEIRDIISLIWSGDAQKLRCQIPISQDAPS
jgi:hypothetical protein